MVAQNELLWATGHGWGRRNVYEALVAAADRVEKRYPGSRVAYMDVSRRKGGRFLPHLSHREGRDVDILYLARWPRGAVFPRRPDPMLLGYFLKYGKNRRHGALQFDEARNWTLLMGLRSQRHARVEKIFVEPYIETWLLEEGRRQGASQAELTWARNTLRYAGDNAMDHKDHMHLRFAR